MRRSLNSFQSMEVKHPGEFNDGVSETIPGQAVSAPELLRRFATGQPLGFKNVTPVYDDPNYDPVPEFYKLSKLDRLHFLQETSQRVTDAKETLSYYKRIEEKQKQEKQNQLKKEQEKAENRTTKISDPLQSEK